MKKLICAAVMFAAITYMVSVVWLYKLGSIGFAEAALKELACIGAFTAGIKIGGFTI